MKKYLHKDQFFINDNGYDSPDYFNATITAEDHEGTPFFSKRDDDIWTQLDIGGPMHSGGGLSYGWNLNYKEERTHALNFYINLLAGLRNSFENLQQVCSELDRKDALKLIEEKETEENTEEE